MFTNNFDPVAFQIFTLEIRWYSLAYIAGILIGWFLSKKIFISTEKIKESFDDYLTYIILGIIIGGRLGYVFFYNFGYYSQNLIEIIMIWQGGMSFHGGLLGVILATLLFAKKNNHNPFEYLDIVALVSPIGIFFGRIANYINSELYGHETNMPWGVKFVQVDDLSRHPTQLYEALCYLGIFAFLITYYYKRFEKLVLGELFSYFLILVFGVRFIIEFIKEPQVGFEENMTLNMGQWLSIPFVLLGIYILYSQKKKLKTAK